MIKRNAPKGAFLFQLYCNDIVEPLFEESGCLNPLDLLY